MSFYDSLGRASVIGLHLVSGTLVGGVMGYGLDRWLGTAPWGLLFFLILGIIAGFRNAWRDAKRVMQESARPAKDEAEGQKHP